VGLEAVLVAIAGFLVVIVMLLIIDLIIVDSTRYPHHV
jgi:hypothetical protein